MNRPTPLVAAAVAAAVLLTGASGCTRQEPRTYTGCTIVDKDRTGSSSSDFDMRVYTENCGTFKVADTFHYRDSADTYGKITVGKVYTLRAIGYRNPGMSRFPNIVEAIEEKPPVAPPATSEPAPGPQAPEPAPSSPEAPPSAAGEQR